MNTVQLTVAMNKITYDTYFLGVLPCDYLPKTPLKDLPAMVIFNTDPSTEPGQHWLAVYVNKDGVSSFFDSFGRGPKNPSFPKIVQDFLKNNSIRVQYSNKQIQDFTSDVCGQHCVFFLYHMSKGYVYENIVKMYYDDPIKNDTMVVRFVKRLKPRLCDTFNCIQCVQICKSL